MFYLAGLLLILAAILSFTLKSPAALQWLVYPGWILWTAGMAFIVASIWTLRRKGRPQQGKDFTKTSVLVDTGIFAVVRHPLYFGWCLIQAAIPLFSRHWLTGLVSILGIACVYGISKQEDRRLVSKFGADYERYQQSVPGLNPIAGAIRLWRHRTGRSPAIAQGTTDRVGEPDPK
jgi:protein-S-isoprenylcysteine O-methyltransferase Ste14